jgi:pimeloyl-ACP methyl ester carboxylesterase
LNATFLRPAPDEQIKEHERAWMRASAAYRATEGDYAGEHGNKPETVAFALAENPVGTAAWIVEKLKGWSDSGNNIESAFTKDEILSNVMVYLVTDSAPTSIWIYRGAREDTAGAPARMKIGVPTGFAAFPHEMTILAPPRSGLERDFNLTHYTKMPKGGHFAAFEQPALYVSDVRDFFRTVCGPT